MISATPWSVRLRQARCAAGFKTARRFAIHVGVSTTSYRNHESGRVEFGPSAALLYAKALGVSPVWLAFGIGRRRAASTARRKQPGAPISRAIPTTFNGHSFVAAGNGDHHEPA